MLIFYPDGTSELQSFETHRSSYDDDKRPSQEFLNTLFESTDIEAIFFEDPAYCIRIDGVNYSMVLADNLADSKFLEVNRVATDLVRSIDLIEQDDVIKGIAVFIAIEELGEMTEGEWYEFL